MDILFSKTGSDGNASVIFDGKTMLMIDAGIKSKVVNKGIDYKLASIQGILITHAHTDHTAYLSEYLRMGINCWINTETACTMPNISHSRHIKQFDSNKQFIVGSFVIVPFEVPHTNSDGTPCKNHAFLIYSTIAKEKMLWATDLQYIEQKLPAMDYICIECNYIGDDDYSEVLPYINTHVEKRRFSAHMSLGNCIKFLKNQDLSKIKFVKLLHLTKTEGKIDNKILDKFNKEFDNILFII